MTSERTSGFITTENWLLEGKISEVDSRPGPARASLGHRARAVVLRDWLSAGFLVGPAPPAGASPPGGQTCRRSPSPEGPGISVLPVGGHGTLAQSPWLPRQSPGQTPGLKTGVPVGLRGARAQGGRRHPSAVGASASVRVAVRIRNSRRARCAALGAVTVVGGGRVPSGTSVDGAGKF